MKFIVFFLILLVFGVGAWPAFWTTFLAAILIDD